MVKAGNGDVASKQDSCLYTGAIPHIQAWFPCIVSSPFRALPRAYYWATLRDVFRNRNTLKGGSCHIQKSSTTLVSEPLF